MSLAIWSLQLSSLCVAALTLLQVSSQPDVCNGHGRPSSLGSCVCEWPYIGVACDTCRQGYHGDPRKGQPCISGCLGAKFLTNFTMAGIGTEHSWLASPPSPSLHPYCWWFVAPSLPTPFISTDIPEFLSQLQYRTSSSTSQSDGVFNISLQFYSSLQSQDSPCCSDKVLVYNGLPDFLQILAYRNTTQSDPIGSLAPMEEPSSVPIIMEELLASFSGSDLRTAGLSVLSSLLTVVYLYSDPVGVGFNATVTVEAGQGAWPEEEEGSSTGQLLPSSCSCVLESCDCDHDLVTTTPIPSLTTALRALTTPTNHTPSCSGRIHHSSTYDQHSDSVFIFGGVDLSGTICDDNFIRLNLGSLNSEGDSEWAWSGAGSGGSPGDPLVRLIGGGRGLVPSGRYLHTATLVKYTEETNCSSIFLLGGFTSREQVSQELWLFNISSEEWTQLTNAPSSLAGHTATLTEEEGVVLVIGGVAQDLTFNTRVMAYHFEQDSWEVWSPISSGLTGVYGHTAVYSVETHSVLVYGGVVYQHPDHTPSPSPLYSLHLPTRSWSIIKLQQEVLPLVFHSMLLSNHQLIVSGGLVVQQQQSGCGFQGMCSSDLLTVVNFNSSASAGKPTVSIQVSPPLSGGWGHTAVADAHNRILLTGGTYTGILTDSVTILHRTNNLCSLARNSSQCHALFGCAACVGIDLSLLECYDTNEDTRARCSLIEGVISESDTHYVERCEEFSSSCRECLLTDVAQNMGCVWCSCSSIATCASSPSDCPCEDSAHMRACPSDECGSPSCSDCLTNENCSWVSVVHNTSLDFLPMEAMTVQCHNSIDSSTGIGIGPIAFDTCPTPCTTWDSCSECVQAFSAQGGGLRCSWSTYSGVCMSDVSTPLLCVSGECGVIVNTTSDCPPIGCSRRVSCDQCLSVPECVWMQERGGVGACVDIAESALSGSDSSLVAEAGVHYLECPQCPADCSGHGQCLASLECVCELGFVGEGCEVECECNGHSNCVDGTFAGRRTCTECQDNTQGASCEECQPFHVGSARRGGRCVPCLDFCNGNSDVCMSRAERSLTGGETNRTKLLEVLSSGPEERVAVCVGCAPGSNGTYCQGCLHDYYDADKVNSRRVNCTRCGCNGHDTEGCNQITGLCSCQNNTISVSDINNQCSACEFGYVGQPTDGFQCYKEQPLGQLLNFALPARRAYSIAVGRDIAYISSDATVTFVLEEGTIDVYNSVNSRAVKVSIDRVSIPGSHRVTVSENVDVQTRSRRSIAEDTLGSSHFSGGSESDTKGLAKRQIQNGLLSSQDNDSVVNLYHIDSDSRLILAISHRDPAFGEAYHYITIFARERSIIRFEYQQHEPRLNLFIFFGLFFSTVSLVSSLMVATWGMLHFILEQRQAALEQAAQERRSNRPLYSIMVYLHDGKSDVGLQACDKSLDSKDELEYREVEEKLRSKSLLLLDGKSTYITRRKPKGKLNSAQGVGLRKRKKHFVKILDPAIAEVWPVTMQPTVDKRASVHSVIVQLPTAKSFNHVLCAGSALVAHSEGKAGLKEEPREQLGGLVELGVRNRSCTDVDGGCEIERGVEEEAGREEETVL